MVIKKSELTERCRKIKDSYKLRTTLNEEDKQWMLEEIFKYHQHWDIKSSKTIKDIIVGNNPDYFYKPCFYLIYEYGTNDDISFVQCINNRPKNI